MTKEIKNEKVIYRVGGTLNFKWREILGHFENGNVKAEEIRRMGYKTIITSKKEFELIGLPATFNADEYFVNR